MKKIIFAFLFFSNITNAQIITTIVGGGSGGGIDGYGSGLPATNATLGNFCGIAFDTHGNLYVADKDRQIIRKIDAVTNIITTVVGNGSAGYSGDGGQATAAQINNPGWIAFDSHGNLYFTDRTNHRVRKVNALGVISTIAGNGTAAFLGDGFAATAASLNAPQGLCLDKYDNIYITDNGNLRIRKISPIGIISTVAGVGTAGYSGDGGAATVAEFRGGYGIRADTNGHIYVSDWNDDRIRKIDALTGIISTVAGNGASTYTGDGVLATTSGISPFDVEVDDVGNIVIADYPNNRIRKVDVSGVISTIAGNGTTGFSGDGSPATAAALNRPAGVAFDKCGNMYIADNQNHRIRKVTYPPILTTPTISLAGITTAPVSSTVTVNATVASAGSSYIIRWMNHGVEFATTSIPVVTYTKLPGTDTITARVVPTSYGCWDSTTAAGHIVASETPSSIFAYGVSGGVYVYPNPAKDELHIENVQTNTTYQLCNTVGSVVQTGNLKQGNNTFFIKHLPPGMYMLQLTDAEGKRTVHKVIKE